MDKSLERECQLIDCYQKDSIPGGGSFTGLEPEIIICTSELQVYPNPADDTLYLTGAPLSGRYAIYSLQGQYIEESKLKSQIQIQHLPRGFCLIQLMDESQEVVGTCKFVKQ